MTSRTIGVLGAESDGSVGHLFRTIANELGRTAEVLATWFDPPATTEQLSEVVARCDAVVGRIERIARLRAGAARPVPGVYIPLGELPLLPTTLHLNVGVLRHYDTIAFSCSADQAIFDSLIARCPAKQIVLPYFADVKRWRPLAADVRARLRERAGYAPDDVVFLYVGRMLADKNVQTILRALSYVPRAKLLLVGQRADWVTVFARPLYDMAFMLPELVGHFGLSDRVTISDPVPHDRLGELYGIADALINLTLHETENFGFTQVEAAACGLPVIGARWGGLKDTIEHGRTGFLVDTWVTPWGVHVDLGQAVDACRTLARDRDLRRAMGLAGQRRARASYSLETFIARLHAELDDCRRRAQTADVVQTTVAYTALGHRVARRTKPFTKRTYRTYARAIAPYASRVASTEPPRASERVFVAPLSVEIGARVRAVDLLWPGRYKPSRRARTILQRLLDRTRTRPAARISTFARTPADRRAVAELVKLGLVVRSRSLARAGQAVQIELRRKRAARDA